MKDSLKMRGAMEVLGNAIVHVGKGHRTSDWNGEYLDRNIEEADAILRRLLWNLEHQFYLEYKKK